MTLSILFVNFDILLLQFLQCRSAIKPKVVIIFLTLWLVVEATIVTWLVVVIVLLVLLLTLSSFMRDFNFSNRKTCEHMD